MYDDLDFVLFDALRRAGRAMRAHKTHCVEENRLPTAKREIVLAILSDNEGAMRHNQLANAFRVSPSTLSEMLNRLESDGLLMRSQDPADRRAILLELTESGKRRADEIKAETRRAFSTAFGSLSDEEKQTLITLLHKIPDPD